jgi:alanyl-tRNA synthetase
VPKDYGERNLNSKIKIPFSLNKALSGLNKTSALYRENPYRRNFDAKVIEVVSHDNLRYIILDRTCFYPEGGGQPGDIGSITSSSETLNIVDTKSLDNLVIHISTDETIDLEEGSSVKGSINWDVRYERMKHHTASHLLFSSSRQVLGLESLMYMGVQVNEDTSRFDISYGKPITPSQILEMERSANQIILENRKVKAFQMTRIEAEEAYGKMLGLTETTPSGKVRVVKIEGWDVALCSGTHVSSTAEIGLVSILDRLRMKKGVERIEFTAGKHAYKNYNVSTEDLKKIAFILKTSTTEAPKRVKNLLEERNKLKNELSLLQERLIDHQIKELQGQVECYGEYKLLKKELPSMDSQALRKVSEKLSKLDPYLITMLGFRTEMTTSIVGSAGKIAVKAGVNMADAIKEAALLIQGGGGGNPEIAQAGGRAPERLNNALDLMKKKVTNQLLS